MNARLDWYGCATYRLTLPQTTVMLDAYLDRVAGAAGPCLTPDAIDRADWILVGHSHFDHLYGAERIAVNTGATVVGSYESVRVLADQGVPEEQLIAVSGGERVKLADGVHATVIPSLHSCVWSHAGVQPIDEVCIGDLGLTLQEQRARFGELIAWLANLSEPVREHLLVSNQNPRGDGGALAYLIETPEGSLLYQDSAGGWRGLLDGLRPDVAILAAAGRPNVDGQPFQGSTLGWVLEEAAVLQPRVIVPTHHDDWMPGFSTPIDTAPVHKALAEAGSLTRLVDLDHLDGWDPFAG